MPLTLRGCNVPIVHVSLFISLIIDLIITDKLIGQGVIAVLNDKALYTLTKYNMNNLYTYSDFTPVIKK